MIERHGARRCALLLVAVLLLPAAPALGDARAEARRHFQDGMSLIREGKYEEGTSELFEAYRILPHPTVLFNIGRAFFDAGDNERAIAQLERYVATDPPDKAEAARLIEIARERLRARDRGHDQPIAPPRSPGTSGPVEPVEPRAPARAGDVDQDQELTLLRQDLEKMLQRVDALQGAGGGAATSGRTVRDRTYPIVPGPSGPPVAEITAADAPGADTASRDDPYAPIVVTSARYGQSPLDAPNAVTILTGDELRASGAASIPDFLRRVPGVDVMSNSPGDYNVGIRGFNDRLANKVLVLIDGRSIYLDSVGATIWPLASISPADVERIEIVRGPGAALYGASAFSGVINIITRSPGQASDEPVAEVWAGFPDQGGASLRFSDRLGPTAYRASFSVEQKRRWYREVDPARLDYELVAPHPDDAVRVGRVDLRIDHRLGRHTSVSASGGLAAGQNEFVAIGALRDFYLDGYQSYLRGDLLLPAGFSVRTFWNHSSLDVDQWARPLGGISLANHPTTDVIDTEVSSFREVDLGVTQRFNIGAGYRFKAARWNWLGSEPEEHHASIFFQDEALLTDDLHAIASLRLDRHPLLVDIGDAAFTDRYGFSPRGALVWRFAPGQSVHATVGTAFRTPTFLESYISTPVPTTTDAVVVRNVGNLDLLPERILGAELGWRSEPASSRYQLEGTTYFNRVSSLIELSDLRPWPDGQSTYDPAAGIWYAGDTTYVNVDQDYDAIGVELGGKVFPSDGLDLYASGSYETIDRGGKSIESTSPLKLSAGAQLRSGGLSLSGDAHFVSAQTWALRSFDEAGQTMDTDVDLPAYVWAGARLSYLIPDSRLELAVAGQNLLAPMQEAVKADPGDTSEVTTPRGAHREHPLGQPIPLSVYATLTYKIW
ncbi:MAG TPA: TonB-dependent receptor [Kofleriaceae bacterium]|nr:TonB-dependent receptor [Kofleriaceae bacterium]